MLWTVACQALLSMGFSRQEYWNGLPFPSPGNLPDPGIEPMSPALAGGFFTPEYQGSPVCDAAPVKTLGIKGSDELPLLAILYIHCKLMSLRKMGALCSEPSHFALSLVLWLVLICSLSLQFNFNGEQSTKEESYPVLSYSHKLSSLRVAVGTS